MGTLWNVSSLVLLVVLVLAIFIGYQRGLIKILFSMVTLILTILLTAVIFPPVNHFLSNQTTLQENIGSQIQAQIEESTGQKLEEVTRSAQESFIASVPLPAVVKDYLSEHNNSSGYVAQGVSGFAEYVSTTAAGFAVSVIAFLVTFVVVRLLLHIILTVLHVVEYLPGVKSVNHLGGAIASVGQLLLILWLFCAFAAGLSGTSIGALLQGVIRNNLILSVLYEHNLLLRLLSGVLGM